MSRAIRLLVVDAYDESGRAALQSVGATPAGRLYAQMLTELAPSAEVAVANVDSGRSWMPARRELEAFSGIVWTGSNLTIHRPNDAVRGQLDLTRAAFSVGVPQFGSCWAVHLAVVGAGGHCAPNERGREFGVSRKLTLTLAGINHPMLRGRPNVFEAFTSHEDVVVSLPSGAAHLVRNDFAEVQAVDVRHERGWFWAVQYHPEYDFREVACLARLRYAQLVREGRFSSDAEAEKFAADYRRLHDDSEAPGLRAEYEVSEDVLDPVRRRREVVNWLAAVTKHVA